MNNKALTLSLVMAVIAVFFVQSYVSSIEDQARKKFGAQVLVVTAKRDIKEMDTINETMLQLKLVPTSFLEPAAISYDKKDADDKEVIKSMKSLAGNIAILPVKKGEQLTYSKISEPGIRTGLAPQITPGKRAIAFSINETTSVSKLVKPGDRIDVIAIVDPGGGKDQKISRTVLQDVVVLATGRSVSNNAARIIENDPYSGKDRVRSLADDFTFGSITIEVDPVQAQQIALIQANGDGALVISLRNNDDGDRYNLGATTFVDLMGDVQRRAPAAGGRR